MPPLIRQYHKSISELPIFFESLGGAKTSETSILVGSTNSDWFGLTCSFALKFDFCLNG